MRLFPCLALFSFLLAHPLLGDTPPGPVTEIWDTTTLDPANVEKPLAGGPWQLVQGWQDLEKIPDFSKAMPVTVPNGSEGAYRTTFTLDAPGPRRTYLHFDAVAYRCNVFVNGKKAGGHVGGVTPFELDVTDLVKPGANELVVLVLGTKGRMLSAEAHNGAATTTFNDREQAVTTGGDKMVIGGGMWPADGIRQGVFVRQVSPLHVGDVTIVTSFRQKNLAAHINLVNPTGQNQPVSIQFDVLPYDIPSAKTGPTPVWSKTQQAIANAGGSSVDLTQPWADAKLWMPQDAHLYVARVKMLDGSGNALDERNVRFGFREVWIDHRNIVLNGKIIRWFTYGDCDAEAAPQTIKDRFRMLFNLGMNMVRASCRPPLPHYADIADEMGMPLIGESELCFNSNFAYEQPVFWSNFEHNWRERIARDKNHPSILIWSIANEVIICSPGAVIGQHFNEAYQHLRVIDPTRPFMQEGDTDQRDMIAHSVGYPIDIINFHDYDVSSHKNPLWACEFPTVAWDMSRMKTPQDIPCTNKFGDTLPDATRPWFAGEFNGAVGTVYPDTSSFWTGPKAYRDLLGLAPGIIGSEGEITVIEMQAFRDMGFAELDPWDTADKPCLAPYLLRGTERVTTFSPDMTGHWIGGKTASRHIVTLNDSYDPQNLKLSISLQKTGGQELARGGESFTIPMGQRHDTNWTTNLPNVSERTPCQLVVQLTDDKGKVVSTFKQDWVLYPDIAAADSLRNAWLCGTANQLGAIAQWGGTTVRPASDAARVDRVRPDFVIYAGTPDAAAQEGLDRFVTEGGTALLLGADHVFSGQTALAVNPDSESTRVFLGHKSPLTAGMTERDWEFWQPDHMISHGNYTLNYDSQLEYPVISGGRNGISNPPVAVLKKGKGVFIACRLQLNPAVVSEPAARVFLNNLAAYAAQIKTAAAAPAPMSAAAPATLSLFVPDAEKPDWEKRFAAVHVPVNSPTTNSTQTIAFLTGTATPDAPTLTRITNFVQGGGTLWLHRLKPDSAFLSSVSTWLGQPVSLLAPKMWLQQLELDNPDANLPLLNGFNDFITCWAAFGWSVAGPTQGMDGFATTPIADFLLAPAGFKGETLLREPQWGGKWQFAAGAGTLSQAILNEVGQHPRNDNPGIGLAVFTVGKGRIVLDQVRWDSVMDDSKSESTDKARYFPGTLWKNLIRQGP